MVSNIRLSFLIKIYQIELYGCLIVPLLILFVIHFLYVYSSYTHTFEMLVEKQSKFIAHLMPFTSQADRLILGCS